jgi:FtsH-binding integral membrane protein
MHFFAVILFVSLGIMGLTMLGERATRQMREGRAFMAGAIGVGLAWLANLDMWTSWGIGHLRYAWVGVTLTGLAIGGSALVLYAVFGFFAGLHRKLDDQAEVIESSDLRRIEPISRAS